LILILRRRPHMVYYKNHAHVRCLYFFYIQSKFALYGNDFLFLPREEILGTDLVIHLLLGDLLLNPVQVSGHLSAHAGEASQAAAIAEADDAAGHVALAQQGAAGVALAGVQALGAGADHVAGDEPGVLVHGQTV
jgi:hypothetical protein